MVLWKGNGTDFDYRFFFLQTDMDCHFLISEFAKFSALEGVFFNMPTRLVVVSRLQVANYFQSLSAYYQINGACLHAETAPSGASYL